MSDIIVNANRFRIADACKSTEEARYYLNGVFVDPAPAHIGGVFLVSTDGHRLICVHDPKGHASAPAIVQLEKATLSACKVGKREVRRELRIDLSGDYTAQAFAIEASRERGEDDVYRDVETARPVAIQSRCVVDGTFPDWRRVLPGAPGDGKHVAAAFDGEYLAAFGKLGRDLNAERNHTGAGVMRVLSADAGSPALIRWSDVDFAFGVLMPMRGSFSDDLPTFITATPARPEEEAA